MALLLLFLTVATFPAWTQDNPLRRAARLDADQKCEESEAIYRKELRVAQPSVPLLNNAGNHYLICGDQATAQIQFERILEINPRHENANFQLARLAVDRHDGASASQFLSRIAGNRPDTRLLRAEAAHWTGKPLEARAILDRLWPEIAGDARLQFLYGMTCARIGVFDLSEMAFSTVLAKRPDDFDALFNLGRAAARANDFDRARRVLETALRLQPASVEALLELGQLSATCQDFTRAIYYLSQAKTLAPKRTDILLSLARAAQSGAYYGDAALAYEQYLALVPGDDPARRDHALVAGYNEKRRAGALLELNAYVTRHPDDSVAYYNLAQLMWRDEPERAIGLLARAVQLNPSFAAAHLDRAWLLQRQGAARESINDLEAAVRINPQDFRALDLLGLAYSSLERAADAESVLRRALQIAPDDPDVLMHLGRALMEIGQEEEAQRLLARFQALRPDRVRGPRRQAGLIEAASLSAADRTARELQRLREVAAQHPDDPELQLHLSTLLLSAGYASEAAEQFRLLLAQNAGSAIWEKAGTFLLEFAQYPMARDFLSRAASDRPEANLDLAVALFFAEGPSHALDALRRVPGREKCGDCLLLEASILDAAGQASQAAQTLDRGLQLPVTRPRIVQLSALLLIRHNRQGLALELLDRASGANQELLLTKALVLGLMKRNDAALQLVKELETQSPEWDRAYLLHGLLLEQSQPQAAVQKIRTAVALGSKDPPALCALARLTGVPDAHGRDPRCACARGLSDVLYSSCTPP